MKSQGGSRFPFAAARFDAAQSTDWSRRLAPGRTVVTRCALGAIAAGLMMLLAFVIDLHARRTVLLTPVNADWVHVCEFLGALPGLTVIAAAWYARRFDDQATLRLGTFAGTVIFAAPIALLGAAFGAQAAWWIADAWAFHGREAKVEQRSFRIVDFDRVKDTYHAVIEPFPEAGSSDVYVGEADYRKLWAADRHNKASPYCVRAEVQATGAAVRMIRPTSAFARVEPCPKTTDDHWQ